VIVLSLVLVIIAAVLLVLGVFQDGLLLIYLSIGACLLAMALLGVGVILRRRRLGTSAHMSARSSTASTRGPVPAEPSAPAEPAPAEPRAAAPPVPQAPAGRRGTGLSSVKGLGPAEREALLDRFGSEQGLRDASIDELTEVRGIGPGLARAIKDALG
jgi:predicted flap endonuclease-1-like 5' DNA nuclease